MARWYRSGRYYGKYRSSAYKKRSYRKGTGQMRAAKQQADQAKVVLNVPSTISCFNKKLPVNGVDRECGTYVMNIYDLLRKSEFYQSYASMYDEFKIDNIKVKLIPVAYNVGDSDSKYSSLTVYTAWDRTGLSQEQIYIYGNEVGTNADYIGYGPANADTDHPADSDGVYPIIGSNITTYSSAESRQVTPGTNTTITRWLKPKTITEKAQWISTSCIDKWYDAWDNDKGRYYGVPTWNADDTQIAKIGVVNSGIGVSAISWSPAVNGNPAFIGEDPNIKFKPTLLIGIYPSVEDSGSMFTSNNKVVFNVETEVSVTFRGLRKAPIVS